MRLAIAALLITSCATTTPVPSEAPGTKRLPTTGVRTPGHHAHPAMHRSRRRRPAASRSQHRLPWDSRLFDRLARCESDGHWHINTSNGYYGGLQFAQSTWTSFGGRRFAARADLATRTQQVTVAVRVLMAQGVGAWPTCSVLVGAR